MYIFKENQGFWTHLVRLDGGGEQISALTKLSIHWVHPFLQFIFCAVAFSLPFETVSVYRHCFIVILLLQHPWDYRHTLSFHLSFIDLFILFWTRSCGVQVSLRMALDFGPLGCFLNAEIPGVLQHICFSMMLGTGLHLCVLGKHSTNRVTSQPPSHM